MNQSLYMVFTALVVGSMALAEDPSKFLEIDPATTPADVGGESEFTPEQAPVPPTLQERNAIGNSANQEPPPPSAEEEEALARAAEEKRAAEQAQQQALAEAAAQAAAQEAENARKKAQLQAEAARAAQADEKAELEEQARELANQAQGPSKSVPQDLAPVLPAVEDIPPAPTSTENPLAPRLAAPPGLPSPPTGPANPAPAAPANDSGALSNAVLPGQTMPNPATPQPPGALPPATGPQPPEATPSGESEVTGPEFAIILDKSRFHPSRIRIKAGRLTDLLFTTVNPKPAALIIEKLKVQTWIPSTGLQPSREPSWEVNRELGSNRVTRIPIKPEKGTYLFHDAITGASGEIIVE